MSDMGDAWFEPDEHMLSPADYEMIGRLVVKCGHIEDTLKWLPLFLLDERRLAGVALTSHLNFRSLLDINRTVLGEVTLAETIAADFHSGLQKAEEAYNDRNIYVHGPIVHLGGDQASTFTFTARGKLKSKGYQVDFKAIVASVELALEAENLIQRSWDALREERAQQGLYREGAPIRWAEKRASPQTPPTPPQS